MFGGPGGGSFFNLGTPEVIVIGAVAWAVLGPKELFRLSRQAGEFLGQWQQLGMQAKQQFTDAIESEIAEDEMNKAEEAAAKGETYTPKEASAGKWFEDIKAEAQQSLDKATGTVGSSFDSLPSLDELAAARAASSANGQATEQASNVFSAEEEAALRESMYETLGDPASNSANFADQMSGGRNAQVMAEYPNELEAPLGPVETMDEERQLEQEVIQTSDELLLETQIAAAENDLATLQAEKKVLALKRMQLEANAKQARQLAEERMETERMAAEERVAAAADDVAAADASLADAEQRVQAAEKEAAAEAAEKEAAAAAEAEEEKEEEDATAATKSA